MSNPEPQLARITMALHGHVGVVELQRPPNNHFDVATIREIAEALEWLDRSDGCRAVVLQSAGKHFCSGADFSAGLDSILDGDPGDGPSSGLYGEALRLFGTRKPIVAAVQGAAVGGGLGLALAADFRVTCREARFSANFARMGFHQGFGLTVTLPRCVGPQRAAMLLYTGRRLDGEAAVAIGLADVLVEAPRVQGAAMDLALEIAASGPLGVQAIRATMRRGLVDELASATDREIAQQRRLGRTADFREGTGAMAERRMPAFEGR